MLEDQREHRDLKAPTTYEEQIQLFIKRGLKVENKDEALSILKRINYYRFTAYALTFKENDQYYAGTTFNKIYRHYKFDSILRNQLMEIIEYIEISFRSQISYYIAHSFGPLEYEEAENFHNPVFHAGFLRELHGNIEKQSKEILIAHYKNNYNDRYPIWVATEVSTLSMISMLFKNLKLVDKKKLNENLLSR